MKKSLVMVAVVLIIAVMSLTLMGCGSYDAKMKEGRLDKATSLSIGQDGHFKILQFTDTHLISNGDNNRDKQTLRWMREAVEEQKPDLVELTGDITGNGTKDRNSGILAIANMFEEMEQYWAYSFGNHDGEWSKVDENGEKMSKDKWIGKEGKKTLVRDVTLNCHDDLDNAKVKGELFYGDNTKGNQEIFDLLHGYKYCLSRQDPLETKDAESTAAMGVGNYVIELKDNAGAVKFALIHMDTHGKMYFNPEGNTDPAKYKDAGYVGLTEMQIQWYRDKAKKYADIGVKSAIFMHIPHFGFREVTEDKAGVSDFGVPYFKEKENLAEDIKDDLFNELEFVKEEGIYSCRWDDNLEKAVDEFKTTNMIAAGHDHNNCFYVRKNIGNKYTQDNDTDNEIMIAYGRCSGVNAWGRLINIGATVYDIDTNGSTIDEMYDVKVVYPGFKYVQKYKWAEINCTAPHLN